MTAATVTSGRYQKSARRSMSRSSGMTAIEYEPASVATPIASARAAVRATSGRRSSLRIADVG
jgi:hypothetical protein